MERSLYTQERLSVVISQLLDRSVLPTLFMRTVMQSLALYPRLSGYVINVLFRLIQKQVWKSSILWDGFIRCCVKMQPKSYQVLLQLPPQQLEAVFVKEPDLKTQLRRCVDTFSSAQRTQISRGVFEVLMKEEAPENPRESENKQQEQQLEDASEDPSKSEKLPECQKVREEKDHHDGQSSGAGTPVCDEVSCAHAK